MCGNSADTDPTGEYPTYTMRHIALLTILVFGLYFGWHYLPETTKEEARKFRGTHLFKVVCLALLILLAFMLQATFGSGKIF